MEEAIFNTRASIPLVSISAGGPWNRSPADTGACLYRRQHPPILQRYNGYKMNIVGPPYLGLVPMDLTWRADLQLGRPQETWIQLEITSGWVQGMLLRHGEAVHIFPVPQKAFWRLRRGCSFLPKNQKCLSKASGELSDVRRHFLSRPVAWTRAPCRFEYPDFSVLGVLEWFHSG